MALDQHASVPLAREADPTPPGLERREVPLEPVQDRRIWFDANHGPPGTAVVARNDAVHYVLERVERLTAPADEEAAGISRDGEEDRSGVFASPDGDAAFDVEMTEELRECRPSTLAERIGYRRGGCLRAAVVAAECFPGNIRSSGSRIRFPGNIPPTGRRLVGQPSE